MADQNKPTWADARVGHLKTLKAPTDAQALLIELHGTKRGPEQDRIYDTLVRAERAAERAQKAQAEAARLTARKRDEDRKARAHRLIQLGLAFEMAGAGHWSHEEAVGLLHLTKNRGGLDDASRARCGKAGADFLKPPAPAPIPESGQDADKSPPPLAPLFDNNAATDIPPPA